MSRGEPCEREPHSRGRVCKVGVSFGSIFRVRCNPLKLRITKCYLPLTKKQRF